MCGVLGIIYGVYVSLRPASRGPWRAARAVTVILGVLCSIVWCGDGFVWCIDALCAMVLLVWCWCSVSVSVGSCVCYGV